MAERFQDNPIFFVVKEDVCAPGNRYASSVVVKRYGDGELVIACNEAKKLAKDDRTRRYHVMAWSLGEGIGLVMECANGEPQPAYPFYGRNCGIYFAPVIMPRVAEYLDTQARALSPVPVNADAGEVVDVYPADATPLG